MSMTREEAARILDPETTRKALLPYLYDPERRVKVVEEACRIAVSALRPICREQVEKVWKGEWKCVPKLGVYDMECSKCGYSPGIRFYSSEFCPNCGAPLTDEAVQMVMERMEALLNVGAEN